MLTALHPSRQCVRVHGAPCKAEWMHSEARQPGSSSCCGKRLSTGISRAGRLGSLIIYRGMERIHSLVNDLKKKTKTEGNLWGRMSR